MNEDNFVCPDCGCEECELEQDWDDFDGDMEIVAEDLVCNNCGYREILY